MLKKISKNNKQESNLEEISIILTKGQGNDYIIPYSSIIDQIKEDIYKDIFKEMLLTSIGDLYINTLERFKNQLVITTPYLQYLLCDGRSIKSDQYPELARLFLGNDFDTNSEFNLPNFLDATIRNLPSNTTRGLGTFEDDAMQSHTHSNIHNHSAYQDKHSHNVIIDPANIWKQGQGPWGQNYASLVWEKREVLSNEVQPNVYVNNSTIVTDEGNGKNSSETRMKNVAVQIYIKARVLI